MKMFSISTAAWFGSTNSQKSLQNTRVWSLKQPNIHIIFIFWIKVIQKRPINFIWKKNI